MKGSHIVEVHLIYIRTPYYIYLELHVIYIQNSMLYILGLHVIYIRTPCYIYQNSTLIYISISSYIHISVVLILFTVSLILEVFPILNRYCPKVIHDYSCAYGFFCSFVITKITLYTAITLNLYQYFNNNKHYYPVFYTLCEQLTLSCRQNNQAGIG